MKHKISPLAKPLFGIVTLAATSVLMSCFDSKIQSSDIPEITQSIFIVPEHFAGEPYNRYAPSDVYYVNINEKIRLWAIYSVNGDFIPTDQSIELYNTHKWTIDNKESSASSVYYSFDKAGVHRVSFETVDHLGDTLRSYADIYVNTPTTISLQSPSNGFNQVNGKNKDGLELAWNIYGIDNWETTSCTVYASYYFDEVWLTPLGETDCNSSVILNGELDPEKNEEGKIIDHSTENTTIYWGVRAITQNELGHVEQSFSEVFHFSTTLRNYGNAIVEVPVVNQYGQYPEKSKLKVAFISAAGDTLSKNSDMSTNSIIRKTFPPQSNVTILVCDTVLTEYGCNSMTIDLAPSTKTRTDTLYLQDKIRPNMVPTSTEFPKNKDIKFFVLDNGSGVNASKFIVIMNEDTLKTSFDDYTLSIPNTCKSECNLSIYAEDYARNKAPDVYWKIKVYSDETSITGPYSKLGGH